MSDAPTEFDIRSLHDHDYLVVVRRGAERAESEFRVSAAVMRAVDAGDEAEQHAVRETAAFLLEHQPLIDLPPLIDFDDVAAAYDGYLDELRRRLVR
jgi:hypothetical protein